jgi:hypothetical protein
MNTGRSENRKQHGLLMNELSFYEIILQKENNSSSSKTLPRSNQKKFKPNPRREYDGGA